MKSFGLSREDKNDWRLRIKLTTGKPRFTSKMVIKMVCDEFLCQKRQKVKEYNSGVFTLVWYHRW